jgi:hypothetical protein
VNWHGLGAGRILVSSGRARPTQVVRCIGKEFPGLIRVDRPGAVAAQRSMTNSVQSGTIKHCVEGDEGGWWADEG